MFMKEESIEYQRDMSWLRSVGHVFDDAPQRPEPAPVQLLGEAQAQDRFAIEQGVTIYERE